MLWREALNEEVAHASASGAPLSLLLIELEEVARLRSAESPDVAAGTLTRFLQAVRSVVRRQDILARESEERIWVIARNTTREGAHALAERALVAIHGNGGWRGAPPSASAGVAVYGQDADDADGLVARCEEDRYAAAAAGSGVSWPAA